MDRRTRERIDLLNARLERLEAHEPRREEASIVAIARTAIADEIARLCREGRGADAIHPSAAGPPRP
jgi:hypothetical protein